MSCPSFRAVGPFTEKYSVFLQKEVAESDFNTFPLLLWLQIPGLSFPHSTIVTQNLVWFSLFFSLLPCSSITITTSCFPVPSICSRDPVNDWFESLAECLHWNVRKKQNYLSSEDEEFWGRFQDLRGLVQGLQDSWGPGLSLTVLCAILSFTDMGGGWGRGRGGLGGVSPNSIQQTITLMLPFIRI